MGFFSPDKKPGEAAAVDTIIGPKAKLKGELISAGSVNINGEFEGRVESKGEVIISRGSRIIGNVIAANITVSGRVEGNILASQVLEITRSGRVNGDLSGGKVIIEEGSSYSGKVNVNASQPEQTIVEIVEEKAAVPISL